MSEPESIVDPHAAPDRRKGRPLATERLYGTREDGTRFLVAAEGQPIPEGYDPPQTARKSAPASDHARKGPGSSAKRSARRKA